MSVFISLQINLIHGWSFTLEDDEDDNSIFSDISIDSLELLDYEDEAIRLHTNRLCDYHDEVFKPIEDESIAFGRRLLIEDVNKSTCLSDFRFRKKQLQDFENQLWPRIAPFLNGHKDHLLLGKKYRAPYETCLLVTLYRFSYPRRLKPLDGKQIWDQKIPYLCNN